VDRDAIRAVTLVSSDPRLGQEVVRAVRWCPEVEQLHSTLGAWDLVVQLRAPSMADFGAALERIRAVPGVRETQTSSLVNSLTGR
jgi:DNA-binding Lrp family transcriptional regulator